MPADWRKSFYYHYYEYPKPHHVRPQYGVITDRYKLVHFYYDADYWELFDRQKDPEELRSVFGQHEYAGEQKKLEAELARLRVELKDTNADTGEDVRGSNEERLIPERIGKAKISNAAGGHFTICRFGLH